MDAVEARKVLNERLAQYRALSYAELAARVDSIETVEISRPNNQMWQLEFMFYWDRDPGGDVRVIAAIDDGGLRALFPLATGFVKGPSGEFIGE